MTKLILSIALTGALTAAYGQGTVQFSNGVTSKLSTSAPDGSGLAVMPITDHLEFGLFYGIGSSSSMTLLTSQFGVNSTSLAGLIASPTDQTTPLNVVQIPGTQPSETDVWISMAAWSAAYGTDWQAAQAAYNAGVFSAHFFMSAPVNVNGLGATAGPSLNIWQSATGTNPHLINAFTIPMAIPEPASLALLGLSGTALYLLRRRTWEPQR